MTSDLLEPVVSILLGFLLGLAVEQLIGWRIRRHKLVAPWKIDAIIVAAMRGLPLIWCTLIGIYVAVIHASLNPATTSLLIRLLRIPFILSVTLLAIRLSTSAITLYSERRNRGGAPVSLARNLTNALIILLGILIILQSLGVSITPALAALGITGLAVSLALEDTLSNVFSGLYIILSKQNQPGDYVRLKVDERDHIEGYITDITWRSTKIRLMPARMRADAQPSIVNVPNARMAADIVIVHHWYNTEHEIRVDVAVCAGNDLDRIEQLTLDVATAIMRDTPGITPDMPPLVRYRAFTPTAIELTIVIYGDETVDQHLLRHRLVKHLYQRYQHAGISVVQQQAVPD